MSAHTPGPWVVAGHPGDKSGTHWRAVHTLAPGPFSPAFVCQALETDARVIAEAPDMLALMRDLTTVWDAYERDGPVPLDQIIQRARFILARVEGGAA
jgi:hypothetical protein